MESWAAVRNVLISGFSVHIAQQLVQPAVDAPRSELRNVLMLRNQDVSDCGQAFHCTGPDCKDTIFRKSFNANLFRTPLRVAPRSARFRKSKIRFAGANQVRTSPAHHSAAKLCLAGANSVRTSLAHHSASKIRFADANQVRTTKKHILHFGSANLVRTTEMRILRVGCANQVPTHFG